MKLESWRPPGTVWLVYPRGSAEMHIKQTYDHLDGALLAVHVVCDTV